MRVLFLAAAVLTLAACGGGSDTNNMAANTMTDANMMATDNMAMDANMAMDPNMSMDANMMNGAAMNGSNMADPAMQNAMQQDMNTNSPDTNLANGM